MRGFGGGVLCRQVAPASAAVPRLLLRTALRVCQMCAGPCVGSLTLHRFDAAGFGWGAACVCQCCSKELVWPVALVLAGVAVLEDRSHGWLLCMAGWFFGDEGSGGAGCRCVVENMKPV